MCELDDRTPRKIPWVEPTAPWPRRARNASDEAVDAARRPAEAVTDRAEPWATLAVCAEYLDARCADAGGVGMEAEAGLLDRVLAVLATEPTTPTPEGREAAGRPAAVLREAVEMYHMGRCYPCGWTLSATAAEGCVPGNCAFRPSERSTEHGPWLARTKALEAALDAPAGEATAAVGGAGLIETVAVQMYARDEGRWWWHLLDESVRRAWRQRAAAALAAGVVSPGAARAGEGRGA